MRVLLATAEYAPVVAVGGLADATAGLAAALRARGVVVEVAVPAYGGGASAGSDGSALDVPGWAGPARVVETASPDGSPVFLIDVPGIARPHPYTDHEGLGWPDNDRRFLAFSAAVAAFARLRRPDVLHLNDWHTGAVLGFILRPPPTVLTIHNLAYQGVAAGAWLDEVAVRPDAFEWYGGINPLSGAIALTDRIVAVSPRYSEEIVLPENGFGLDGPLRARGDRLSGIRNGIDTSRWDPARDDLLQARFSARRMRGKSRQKAHLCRQVGWEPDSRPLIGMVSRLVEQKGIDLALRVAQELPQLGSRMVLLGSGERALADRARHAAREMPGNLAFVEAYDEGLAHRIFGGSDLYLMPSRFEPCGLAQMQAMAYGSIPVVTDVGGLHDTVADADADPIGGSGFVAATPTPGAVLDAVARAVRAWRSTARRGRIRRNGMTADWSWRGPAVAYLALYEEIIAGGVTPAR